MPLIKRSLFSPLVNHISSPEISLIVGARQVGKTTLMKTLKEYLEKMGEKTLFLNLDYEPDKQYFSSQENLIQKIKLETGGQKTFVFIDEIQRKENAGLFLKGIYDLNLPYKFIISGSGSLELKEKIHESLAGRKRVFELLPISFSEFVNFKTDYQYENNILDFFKSEKLKTNQYLLEYLNFGGYPRIIDEPQISEKILIINEIFKSYLEKDMAFLLKIERPEAFSLMIKLMAQQIGNLLNYTEICSYTGLSIPTLKKYIFYAEKTFIINLITPFFRNKRKEITKSPIIYFQDLGLRNFVLNLFGNLADPLSLSFVFQNFIANHLFPKIQSENSSLHFWRTKDQAEVDLIIEKGNTIIPVEIKYKNLKKPEIGKSFRNFIEKYSPQEAWLINLSLKDQIKIKNTEVKILPFYEMI